MNIAKILIIVELEDGSAHQILAPREQKYIALKMCANETGKVVLDKRCEPFELKYAEP